MDQGEGPPPYFFQTKTTPSPSNYLMVQIHHQSSSAFKKINKQVNKNAVTIQFSCKTCSLDKCICATNHLLLSDGNKYQFSVVDCKETYSTCLMLSLKKNKCRYKGVWSIAQAKINNGMLPVLANTQCEYMTCKWSPKFF